MLPSAEAKALLDREPVKNARALLRYALPINDKYVRQMQVHSDLFCLARLVLHPDGLSV